MRKVFIFLITTIMISLILLNCPIAYAISPQMPKVITANDMSDFYGSWELEYLHAFNTTYKYSDLNNGTMYFDLYSHSCLGCTIQGDLKQCYYLKILEFKNNKLTISDDVDEYSLELAEDGHLIWTFKSDGTTYKYCFKQQDNSSHKNLDFSAIARNPDDFYGSLAEISGTVIQVIGTRKSEYYQLRVAVNGNYDDIILVEVLNTPNVNILENDQVNMIVRLCGEYTYSAVWGNEVTIPLAFATNIEIQSIDSTSAIVTTNALGESNQNLSSNTETNNENRISNITFTNISQLEEYSDEELWDLNIGIQMELMHRMAAKEAGVVVPPGKYIIGEDIPAGKYRLYTAADNGMYSISNEDGKIVDSGLLGNTWGTNEVGKLELINGYTLEIGSANITFFTYTGIFH